MRAVVNLRDDELAERRSKGLDRWDEMWEGVLHMTPAPSVEHQRIVSALLEFLRPLLRAARRGELVPGINVFRDAATRSDYRIPDLTFVASGRDHILHADGVRGEGPDAVIEIRSPDDETFEKLPFYAAIGVSEVIVCDRDSRRSRIFRLAGQQYVLLQPDSEGWLQSEALGVRMRLLESRPPRMRIEDPFDASLGVEI